MKRFKFYRNAYQQEWAEFEAHDYEEAHAMAVEHFDRIRRLDRKEPLKGEAGRVRYPYSIT